MTLTLPTRLTDAERAEALFASTAQPSEHLDRDGVWAAVESALLHHGCPAGCAEAVAAEYGDHPDTAAQRMRWARRTVAAL